MTDPDTVRPQHDFDYYTGVTYWNDFAAVQEMMSRLVTGRPGSDWMQHLADVHGRFDHAFMVNCGNGHVERDLFRRGLIGRATGQDIGAAALAQARREAAAIGLPATYVEADVNAFEPERDAYDLIVNVGAMHHVARIDRATRLLARALRPGGLYAAFDYVGPHRNQYSWAAWSRMLTLNASLPERFRVELTYPHMPTMLHLDPSEAVHSELQEATLRRYFDLEQHVPLGGALAYGLLYGSRALFAAQHEPDGAAVIARILDEDRAFAAAHPEDNLFSFWMARPKATPPSPAELAEWDAEEALPEETATRQGGRYYPATALELIYDEMTGLRHQLRVLQGG